MRRKAFTIVEMMVAITVLAVLLVMVSQIVSMASSTIGSDRKRIEADMEARLVLDRMATDFERMPKRRDADYLFFKQAGASDKMFFYSEAPASSTGLGVPAAPANTAALIGYRVNSTPQNPWEPPYCLERLGKQLNWDNSTTQMVYLTMSPSGPILGSTLAGAWPSVVGSAANNYDDGTDPTSNGYHVLGETTFRLKFCFQLIDGTFSDIPITVSNAATNNVAATGAPGPSNDSTGGYSTGSRWFDTTGNRGYICLNSLAGAAVWGPIGLDDVSAVVVAIASLDKDSRKIIQGKIATVAGALPDPGPADYVQNHLMDSVWQAQLNNPGFAGSTIPAVIAGQVRVHQRFFYLGNNKTQ